MRRLIAAGLPAVTLLILYWIKAKPPQSDPPLTAAVSPRNPLRPSFTSAVSKAKYLVLPHETVSHTKNAKTDARGSVLPTHLLSFFVSLCLGVIKSKIHHASA